MSTPANKTVQREPGWLEESYLEGLKMTEELATRVRSGAGIYGIGNEGM